MSIANTRWLSLEAGVKRILEQLVPLRLFFSAEVLEDDTTTATQILTVLNDPTTEPYLEFPSDALFKLNEFNTIFQAESPLLYLLKEKVYELITDRANNFMDLDYVRETNPHDIDAHLISKYVPLSDIYLGKF